MNDIVNMYREGIYSMADVGKAHGISRQRVHQILNEYDVKERDLKRKNKDKEEWAEYGERINQALERYRNGEYLFIVSKELGIPRHVMDRLCHRTTKDIKAHERAKFFNKTKLGDVPEGFKTRCLEWISTFSGTQAIYCVNTNDRSARKWAWYFAFGEKVKVKNICGNRKCVSVEHLQKI